MQPGAGIARTIRDAAARGTPALIGFLTAGFPARDAFAAQVASLVGAADVVEIGVPFSDPMADGATIQRSSRIALESGATLAWILEELSRLRGRLPAPLVLMSYLNPLLAFGLLRLPRAAREAGVTGFIVPDLPWEECGELRAALNREDIALVQMVTPVTPPARLGMLAQASQGFVYAVTMTGTTGGAAEVPESLMAYLDRVRAVSAVPVCAGFGIRSAAQVARLTGHADGAIVGSALVEAIEAGRDAADELRAMRPLVRSAPRAAKGAG
jgi:tryptophan synthase alpha chain